MLIVLSGSNKDNEYHTTRRSCARVKRGNPVADAKAEIEQGKANDDGTNSYVSFICMRER
jgi:hypothetical protein